LDYEHRLWPPADFVYMGTPEKVKSPAAQLVSVIDSR
jgi:hypothetical protein